MEAGISAEENPIQLRFTLASFAALTFIGYFTIGLALAVLPVFIHQQLGFNAMIAGAVISIQYVTTFLMRGYAGNLVDKKGPKPAVMLGMAGFTVSGLVLIAAIMVKHIPTLSLSLLVITRLVTGFGEGLIGASPINWAILTVGDKHTSRAISFNGIASYGALAIGASLGVAISNSLGMTNIGIFIFVTGLGGYFYSKSKKPLQGNTDAPREAFLQVLKKVSVYGICLALGGVGFGTISTFITLYYAYLNWTNAVLCLSVFSTLFILARVVFGSTIDKYGGMRIALACLSLETVGLLLIWLASTPFAALAGAGITGLGFSLVFPALGVEAVKRVPPANKGAALGGYGLFIDISLGITGPMIGAVASHWGMQYIFPFSMGVVFTGLLLAIFVYNQRHRSIV
ncbi:Predicted arabinose efflux permease, MFS family [Filimonas lacunae]|uniref:Uncharacterized MFS-type transporter SAMN05421788_108183 n=1 Tax=Filimonas lacunae TaxID=477680 RepID=A0A173MDR6_9BACT|nr:MFS transporter [Filimonas lacunae]BAV05670.1 xanthine transporter [Filimonas lacunae]SIT28963.1 Predicted arabinose efflux permease, MFS family [Filimonas lacunae]